MNKKKLKKRIRKLEKEATALSRRLAYLELLSPKPVFKGLDDYIFTGFLDNKPWNEAEKEHE